MASKSLLLARALDLQQHMNALKPRAPAAVETSEKIALVDESLEQVIVLLGSTTIDEAGWTLSIVW